MEREYCVYEHIFPNGKRYIGITYDTEKRWRNGKGYKAQTKIAKAIKYYGWENIQHNIIVDGITKEQAETLEKYLIAELQTIEDGYNVSTGGENIIAYYLDAYVLDMIRYVERYYSQNTILPIEFSDGKIGIAEFVAEGKTDKGRAEWANEASRAVTHKHRKYRTTNEKEVLSYWFHMREYAFLTIAMENGEDISEWEEAECPYERYRLKQEEADGN